MTAPQSGDPEVLADVNLLIAAIRDGKRDVLGVGADVLHEIAADPVRAAKALGWFAGFIAGTLDAFEELRGES
ncbi:MAG TPA: hypothetical protein VMX12_13150 [Acidimicrobiia bacterium]|nr:hypothetical protein [Acidimicrobiia bacterium]